MSIIRIGSNENYANGWDKAFGKGKKKSAKAAAPKKKATAKRASTKKKAATKKKTTVKKKTARKKA